MTTNYYWTEDRNEKQKIGKWACVKDGEYYANEFATDDIKELEKITKKFLFTLSKEFFFKFWTERGNRRIYDEYGRVHFLGDLRRRVMEKCWFKIAIWDNENWS